MKQQRQPTSFQRTTDAFNSLIALGISSPHGAVAAIEEGRLDQEALNTVRTAYGTVPNVKKALAQSRQ